MSDISQQLKHHTKDKISLSLFLDFLIKNKIYDSSLYLKNIKDFDNNNLLIKACVYNLYDKLEKLIPHLAPEVFLYTNNNGCTLTLEYFKNRGLNLDILNWLAQVCPSSFAIKKAQNKNYRDNFNPFEILASNPSSFKVESLSILLLFCEHQAHKLNFVLPRHCAQMIIQYRGLKMFEEIDYSVYSSTLNYLFHSFAPLLYHSDDSQILKKQMLEARQSLEKIILTHAPSVLFNPHIRDEVTPNQYKSSFMLSMISAPYNEASLKCFNALASSHPSWLKKLDFNSMGPSQNTLLHFFISLLDNRNFEQIQVKRLLDILLENCHHLNTKNKNGLEPYALAQSLDKNTVSSHIKSFIERKILSSTVLALPQENFPSKKSNSKI